MTFSPLTTALVSAAVAAEENTPDPDQVTPGVVGFIATFFVAGVTVLLVIDMVRRVRRVNYRAQVREQLEAEVAARDAAGADPDAVAAIRAALIGAASRPWFAELARILCLDGFAPVDQASFAPTLAWDADAVEAGYPRPA